MKFSSYHQVKLWNPPPVKSVVDQGVLLEGTKLIIFGEPKTYKSLIAQQLAFTVVLGIPWLGFKTEPITVAFMQAEVPESMFRLRTLKMGRGRVIPTNELYFASERGIKLDRESGVKVLVNAITNVKPSLLIIDPIYKYISGSDESTLVRFTDNIDYLIDKFKLTVVLVSHSRKPKTSSTGQVIDMGGSELRGPLLEMWADSIIRVRGDLASDVRTLDFELRHAESILQPLDVRLDRAKLWFRRV